MGRHVQAGRIVINVQDYGAVGSYNTSSGLGSDDTVAINDALAAAGPAAAFGQVVLYFPPTGAWYRTSTGIILPSNVSVRGERGMWNVATSGSMLYCSTAVPAIRNVDFTAGNRGIRIQGMRIYGNTGGTTNVVDFRAAGSAFCHGIYISECNIINGSGHGISFLRCQESEIERNYINNAAIDAVRLDSTVDTLVFGNQLNTAATTGGNALFVTGSSNNNHIVNNFCFLSQRGIYIVQGRFNVISGNRCNTNRLQGITVDNFSAFGQCAFNTFVGNTCYDNSTSGTGSGAGILIAGYSNANTFIGNSSSRGDTNDQQYGLRLDGVTQGNTIIGNMLSNNGSGTGLQNTATGQNIIFGNQGATAGSAVVSPSTVISDDSAKGFVFKSPDGNYWRQTIGNDGAITTTSVGTTRPVT